MRQVQASNWFGLTNPIKLFVILLILLLIAGCLIWFYNLTKSAEKFENIISIKTTPTITTITKPILIKNVVGAALGYITNNQLFIMVLVHPRQIKHLLYHLLPIVQNMGPKI